MCIAALACITVAARGQDAAAPAVPRSEQFGSFGVQIGELESPGGAAIDHDGTIYIAETGLDRVVVYDRNAKQLRTIGRPGFSDGELQRPADVAVANNGRLYVADTGNHRIVVFDAEGKPLRTWGHRGTAPGEFCSPSAVAATDDFVYVVDTGNKRVQVFTPTGDFVRAIGAPEGDASPLARPVDVAVDAGGKTFVLDADLSKVLVFDAAGKLLTTWGDWGWQAGLLADPGGMTIRDGRLYVADTRNQRIQVFNGDDKVLYDWGKHAIHPHEGSGKIHYPGDVAIAPDGSFAVVTETFENRAQIFIKRTEASRDDQVRSTTWERNTGAHFGRRAVAAGTLMSITEPDTHSVLVYDTRPGEPILIHRLGGLGSGFGQFLRPTGVELDIANRRLFVTDSARRRVQIFALDYDPDGPFAMQPKMTRFVRALDLDELAKSIPPADRQWPIEPTAIRRAPDGTLYLLDARNARVFVLSPELSFLHAWGAFGRQRGQWLLPTDLAVSSDGRRILVTDGQRNCITVHGPDGALLDEWSIKPADADGPCQLFGIAALRDGGFVVTDAAAHRLLKLRDDGTIAKSAGKRGLGRCEFYKPAGVTEDNHSRIIVIDFGNHRGQILSPDLEYLESFGSRFFTEAAKSAARRDRRANRKPQTDAE